MADVVALRPLFALLEGLLPQPARLQAGRSEGARTGLRGVCFGALVMSPGPGCAIHSIEDNFDTTSMYKCRVLGLVQCFV